MNKGLFLTREYRVKKIQQNCTANSKAASMWSCPPGLGSDGHLHYEKNHHDCSPVISDLGQGLVF
jgi:hypothetical protein